MNSKRLISILLAVCVSSSLLGACGKTTATVDSNVELLDPVGSGEAYVLADYRNIYDTQIISASVSPVVTEYSFGDDQKFLSYGYLPGNDVKEGDTLLLADTENVDELIKQSKENINDMVENHEETLNELKKQYEEDKWDEQSWAEKLEKANSENPGENSKNYENWKSGYEVIDAYYRKAWLAYAQSEQAIKELNELFDLDYAYAKSCLNRLQSTRKQATITAKKSGVVVALNYYDQGTYLTKNASCIAVGDINDKELKCAYVNAGVINKAEDVYAIINGKRYEVEYQAIDSEEYNRLNKLNGVVYSTFKINDSANEIALGDYAVIVIVKEIKEGVLCVPTVAVNKDDAGYFVYVAKGDSTEHVEVKKGSSDGAYTEILTGLNQGDKVIAEFPVTAGTSAAVLEKGDIGSSYTGNGYLYYPVVEWVKNPTEYGTTYLEELCVSQYQQVSKGDVIAKIRVIADSVELARKERTIQRLNERINDMIKEDETAYEKRIKIYREQITEIQKVVNKMKSDAGVTEIVAPYDCIVTNLNRYDNESLLSKDAKIVQISESSSSYILVEEEENRLTYGNTATIQYDGADGNKKTATGKVVTVNSMSLSGDMKLNYALILISAEDISDMAGSSMGFEGWWNRSRFSVSIPIRQMKNVVLVPRKAVTDIGGTTYVKIKNDDGTIELRSFVSGGSDSSYYWVVEGLTEGTVVCLE